MAEKSKERMAREALLHAGLHAFHDRRKKKRNMRALGQVKINAASRANGISYSKLINNFKGQCPSGQENYGPTRRTPAEYILKIVAEVK